MLEESSLRTEKGNWPRTVRWFNSLQKPLPWKSNGLLKCHCRGKYLPPKGFPESVSAESIYGACFHTRWDPSLTAYFYLCPAFYESSPEWALILVRDRWRGLMSWAPLKNRPCALKPCNTYTRTCTHLNRITTCSKFKPTDYSYGKRKGGKSHHQNDKSLCHCLF